MLIPTLKNAVNPSPYLKPRKAEIPEKETDEVNGVTLPSVKGANCAVG